MRLPINHDNCPIIESLLCGVIPMRFTKMRPFFQYGKFLIQISVEERKQGDWGQKNIRHKRVDDCRESGRNTTWTLVIYFWLIDMGRLSLTGDAAWESYIRPTATSNTFSESAKLANSSHVRLARLLNACPVCNRCSWSSPSRGMMKVDLIKRRSCARAGSQSDFARQC